MQVKFLPIFFVVAFAASLGAGCAKSPEPIGQVQQPQGKVQPMQPTGESLISGFPVSCFAKPMSSELMAVTLADVLKNKNEDAGIMTSLNTELEAGWSIKGFCVQAIAETSGASPVSVFLSKRDSFKFVWSGGMPTEKDPFDTRYVASDEFSLKSPDSFIWSHASGSKIEGRSDSESVVFDIESRKLSVIESPILLVDLIQTQLPTGYCSTILAKPLIEGKQIDAGTRKLPALDDATKARLSNFQIEDFCFDEKENATFFVAATSSETAVLKLPVRADDSDYRGNGHVLGFWKKSGFGNTNGKIVVSPIIAATGGGDASLVQDLELKRLASGYLIKGRTGGGDGPFMWDVNLEFNPQTKKVRALKQCDYWEEYSDPEGNLVTPGSECKALGTWF